MRDFNKHKRFGRRDSGRSGSRGSGRFDRDLDRPERMEFRRPRLDMHTATCAKCGARCDVPFKPTGERPVYCSDCFRKGDNFESKGAYQEKSEFDRINEKLDRILEALGKG